MMKKPTKTTKEDLRVTDLGSIEPLYNEFDGDMYGTYEFIHLFIICIIYISVFGNLMKATFFKNDLLI